MSIPILPLYFQCIGQSTLELLVQHLQSFCFPVTLRWLGWGLVLARVTCAMSEWLLTGQTCQQWSQTLAGALLTIPAQQFQGPMGSS